MSYHYRTTNWQKNRQPRQPRKDSVTNTDIPARLKALLENSNVDDNTKTFLTSLSSAFKRFGGLTPRQFSAMAKVEYRFSPEAQKAAAEWREQYTSDAAMQNVARVCAEYYKANPPYFADLAEKVIGEPDFIPSKKQYRAMCQNKYAVKVLASVNNDAKYPAGTWVEGRTTANRTIAGTKCVVIATDSAPVTSAAKGAKVYTWHPGQHW